MKRRRPRALLVAWTSLVLFVVLFALITVQLSSQGEDRRATVAPVHVTARQLPEPEDDELDDDGEAIVHLVEEEPEEPEPEEPAPVVTSSS